MHQDQLISKGLLYLIPTPISESSEWQFSPHIIEALMKCSTLICERIRTTRRTIRKFYSQESFDRIQFIEIDKHEGTSYINESMKALLSGQVVGLLSEAGMPCIADPGYELVLAAHGKEITVHPFPGPSSFMMALMASGLNGQSFTFHGYLPRDQDKLNAVLRSISSTVLKNGSSQIFMETPYRNQRIFESVLRIVNDELLLNLSMEINGKNELIKTKSIRKWKKKPIQFDEKYPAVFIIGKK